MKVVINNCFGGFSLSPRGVKAYADRKGWSCYFFRTALNKHPVRLSDEEAFSHDGIFGPAAFRTPNAEDIPHFVDDWRSLSQEQRAEQNRRYDDLAISCREYSRNDPDLIAVVEELGAAANGGCASLAIVEIPDDVDWQIEEYDGREHVAEKHRTWS